MMTEDYIASKLNGTFVAVDPFTGHISQRIVPPDYLPPHFETMRTVRSELRRQRGNRNGAWLASEVENLMKWHKEGRSFYEIGDVLERTENSCQKRYLREKAAQAALRNEQYNRAEIAQLDVCPTFAMVFNAVSEAFEIPPDIMESKSRTVPLVKARQAYFFLAYHLVGKKYSRIGRTVDIDRTTVLHGINRVHDCREYYEPMLSKAYEVLMQKVNREVSGSKGVVTTSGIGA